MCARGETGASRCNSPRKRDGTTTCELEEKDEEEDDDNDDDLFEKTIFAASSIAANATVGGAPLLPFIPSTAADS